MEITIKIKDVYGNRTIYPIDEVAKRFAAIAGTRTLTQATIEQIKALGYKITIQQERL